MYLGFGLSAGQKQQYEDVMSSCVKPIKPEYYKQD